MVAVALMGMVAMAVLTLYQTSQRSATTQSQVVDVQQNVRIALQQMARDIRMADFLLPSDAAPFSQMPDSLTDDGSNAFSIQLASPSGKADEIVNSGGVTMFEVQTDQTLSVPVSTGTFAAGDLVRIVRPFDDSQPADGVYQVTGTSGNLQLKATTGFTPAGTKYVAGDMVVGVANTNPWPPTGNYPSISYILDNDLLKRDNGSGNQELAENISGVAFQYLYDGAKIRAVKVTITGKTTANGNIPQKARNLSTVVRLRN